MTTKLTHPDAKKPIETNNPEAFVSQGWVEVDEKAEKSSEKSDDK